MLTGKSPADADNTIEILMQHVNGLKLDYSKTKVPAWLQACLKHALAKDRENRYATMADFADSLRNKTDKKKQAAPAPGFEKPFVYDPVVLTGVAKPVPGEEDIAEREKVRGVSLGVVIVVAWAAFVYMCYGWPHFPGF
jgi:hypothetical protein